MVDGMNNNFLNRVSSFRQSKKGSVTIEFALTLMILVIVFAFLADLVVQRSTQAKLDNTSLSLVSILRERVQLYSDNGNAALTDGTKGAAGGFSVVGSSDGDFSCFQGFELTISDHVQNTGLAQVPRHLLVSFLR